jgi:hypothetical protein
MDKCSPERERERELQKVRACSECSSFSQSACVIILNDDDILLFNDHLPIKYQ